MQNKLFRNISVHRKISWPMFTFYSTRSLLDVVDLNHTVQTVDCRGTLFALFHSPAGYLSTSLLFYLVHHAKVKSSFVMCVMRSLLLYDSIMIRSKYKAC